MLYRLLYPLADTNGKVFDLLVGRHLQAVLFRNLTGDFNCLFRIEK